MLSEDLRNIVVEAENMMEAGPMSPLDWFNMVRCLYDVADRLTDFERMTVAHSGEFSGSNVVCIAAAASSKDAPHGS